jgi:hypothetical protein
MGQSPRSMTTPHSRILFPKYEHTVAGAQFTIRTNETQLKGVKSIFQLVGHNLTYNYGGTDINFSRTDATPKTDSS